MAKMKNALLIASFVAGVVAIFFFYRAYDVKTNYRNSEEYSIINENAYVGGDAYNYIINGTYFTGYLVVGSASGLGALLLFCFSLYLHYKSIEKTMDGMKAIYEEIKKITAQPHIIKEISEGKNEQSV